MLGLPRKCHRYKLNLLNVSPLSPLSIVGITVALKLGIGAGLVDGAATLLDLSECSTPVIVTLIVTANPETKRSSVYLKKIHIVLVNYISCFP